MPIVYEGKLIATDLKIGVVCGRFNGFIVDSLLTGVIDAVVRTGGREQDISVFWCPGAYEIPQVLQQVVLRGDVDAVVTIGAVIRGATPHFEYVAGEVAKGVAQVAHSADIPVSFGVITTDTIEQAIERAGTKAGNKGFEAAMAAIELVNLYRTMRGDG